MNFIEIYSIMGIAMIAAIIMIATMFPIVYFCINVLNLEELGTTIVTVLIMMFVIFPISIKIGSLL